ncbi:hypothetical protein P8452_14333 [Trifolium repens]|nr:hypothetical protein P8452_14333 [Trifolium repens]
MASWFALASYNTTGHEIYSLLLLAVTHKVYLDLSWLQMEMNGAAMYELEHTRTQFLSSSGRCRIRVSKQF